MGEPEAVLPSPDIMLSYYLIRTGGQDQKARLEVVKKGGAKVGLFFLDSGAFSHWSKVDAYAKVHGGDRRGYYDTKEFYAYMDAYAAFVKEHAGCIDYYANVDAIPDPEITYRNQKYLEKKHGLRPVPVVHYNPQEQNRGNPETWPSVCWLNRYISEGYDLIGLGGLVGRSSKPKCLAWIDACFLTAICSQKTQLPRVRVHGFGMTSYRLMVRYPWWSVDSATWTKLGANGCILVPRCRGGVYSFREDDEPYQIGVSQDRPPEGRCRHYGGLDRESKKVVVRWLNEIDVPLGRTHPKKKDENNKPLVLEYGVVNRHSERKIANLKFFERLVEWLNKEKGPWPWPFNPFTRQLTAVKLSGRGGLLAPRVEL